MAWAEERRDMASSSGPRAKLTTWSEEAGAGLQREEGQTLLEYALIIAFVGMGSIAAMWTLGPAIGQAFQVVTGRLVGISF
jgi:Flp pilus assembly pilin Flp